MGTLNQYAARIANMLNQPNNHELKERAKDMIKTVFANRIRQSVEKHGIDDILKLSFVAPVEKIDYDKLFPTENRIENKLDLLITKYKVPTPVRIHNDAPFTFVGDTVGNPYVYENSITSLKLRKSGRATHLPTGPLRAYLILNGYIVIANNVGSKNVTNVSDINEILISAIFENPDEVLSYFSNNDGQDIELPLPNDMLENIMLEVLKTEFNVYPQDIDIKLNNGNPIITQTSKNKD